MAKYRKSSTFYRLEKNIGDGYKSVFEFHSVVNGNMYYVEHEEKKVMKCGMVNLKRSVQRKWEIRFIKE